MHTLFYFYAGSPDGVWQRAAFHFPYRDGRQDRFFITKGYFNRSALKYPFFHALGSAAQSPPCKPPLALQVPSGKGVDRLLAFPVAGRAEKQIAG